MSDFTDVLVVSPLEDGKTWAIYKEFSYHVGALNSGGTVIVVPEGFQTDFASVPWPLTIIVPRWGKYGKAAVVHDYLYSTQQFERRRADEIFRESMRVLGVAFWRRILMFMAVRVFGRFFWSSNITRLGQNVTKVHPLPQKATDVKQWG